MGVQEAVLELAKMMEQWTLCTVEDVDEDAFARRTKAVPNHPAWVLGHLVDGFDAVTRELGGDVDRGRAWAERFGPGTTPVADRAAYPSKDELLGAFRDAAARLRRAVAASWDAGFEAPTRDAEVRAYFPTAGRWAVHVLLGEVAFHTGQLSAWRRTQGLAPVFADERRVARLLAGALGWEDERQGD